MSENNNHITSYKTNIIVLIVLLFLTFVTVAVTSINLHAWNVALALLIASTKVFLVLTYFMHLKYENVLLRIFVGMVFLLFAVIVVITFLDYLYR